MKQYIISAALVLLALPAPAAVQATTAEKPPQLTNIQTETTTGSSKRVIWDTDRPTVGYVDVYLKGVFAGRFLSPGEPRTHHEVSINNLKNRTDYEVVVKARDLAVEGQNGFTKSNRISFETGRAKDLIGPEVITSTVKVYFKTATTAYITWETTEPTHGTVRYGRVKGLAKHTTTYPNSRNSSSGLARVHDATLTGLTRFSTYHFKIRVWDDAKNTAWSGNFTFGTLDNRTLERNEKDPDKESLEISQLQPISPNSENIGMYAITVTWRTNRPTNATVSYKTARGRTYTIKTKAPKKLEHEVALKNLDPATTYTIAIDAIDGTNKKATMEMKVATAAGPPRPGSASPAASARGTSKTTTKRASPDRYTPTEGLYQVQATDELWTIMRGQRFKITSAAALADYGYEDKTITLINQEDLAQFPIARFVKAPGDKKVYLLDQNRGVKLWIPNESTFYSYTNANFNKVIIISKEDLGNLEEARLVDVEGRSYLYSIDKDRKKHLLKQGEAGARALGFDPAKTATITLQHLSAIASGAIIP